MLHILSFILFILNNPPSVQDQVIQFPFTFTKKTFNTIQSLFNNYPIGTICLGTPLQCIKVGFSIKTYYTWLCHKDTIPWLYDNSTSKTFQHHHNDKVWNFDKEGSSGIGRMGNDTFYFSNSKTDLKKTINFLLPKENFCKDIEIAGEIGLNSYDALHFSDRGHSFIDQINLSNIKYPNAIGVKYFNNHSGIISFGVNDYPNITNYSDKDDTDDKNNNCNSDGNKVYTIKTSPMSGKYILHKIDYVKFKGKISKFSEYAVIHFNIKATVLPKVIYDQFCSDILNQLLPPESCYEYQDDPNYIYYLCNNEINMNYIAPLEIHFEDTNRTIEIDLKDQFMPFGNENKLLFGIIGTRSFDNQIQLGDLIFRRFYVMFERTNHTISLMKNLEYDSQAENLISKQKGITMTLMKRVMMKMMQFFFISILLCVIVYLVILYKNKRRLLGENYEMITDQKLPRNKDIELKQSN